MVENLRNAWSVAKKIVKSMEMQLVEIRNTAVVIDA